MTENENNDFLIEIEKSDDVTRIRISGVRKNKFEHAYKLASHLTKRAKELDIEIEEERKLHFAKMQMNHLWTREDALWKLDESITDASYRIALSLLRNHPECKKQVDVVNKTGLAKMTVSDNLSGKVKATRQYFLRYDKGYRLSDEGIQWVFDEIAPFVSSLSNESPSEGV